MTRWPRVSLSAALFLAALSVQPSRAGNTTCVSRQLDWYTSVVGESPCMTYQRLRQICNNEYEVPTFKSTVPGDLCDDQISTCCSNTIAFQLSMLCMVCQRITQDTGSNGIDAPKGTFDVYINGKTPVQNNTLPDNLQCAVCNNNIRLDDFLYGGWDDGSWFYVYTKENAELGHASNDNNTFTHCPNQISSASTAKPASLTSKSASQTPKSASSKPTPTGEAGGTVTTSTSTKSISHGALIGGVVGGVLGLTIIVIATIVWMRKRRRTVSGKGIEWSQNPRFAYMHSSTQASGGAPKTSLAQSKFSMGGPLSSGFSFRDPDCVSIAGRSTTCSSSWKNAPTRPPSSSANIEQFPRPDEKASLDRPLHSNPRSFSQVYGTGSSEGSQYSTTHTKSHSDELEARPGSVSLSTFDFAGSQVPDDGQTTRSFPRSVMANGHTTAHGPSRSNTRPPAYGGNTNTGAPESRDRWHYT